MNFKQIFPGIVLYDNVFTNAGEHIKKIEASGIEWIPAPVLLDSSKDEGGTNYESRNTDVMRLPHPNKLTNDILSDFVRDFHMSIGNQLSHYLELYGAQVKEFEKPQLLRYGKGQKFDTHFDDHPFFTRRISMTYYVNDDYTGGEISFDKFGVEVKASKNQLLVFPSNYIYSHKVSPVIDGTRYAVVQWIA